MTSKLKNHEGQKKKKKKKQMSQLVWLAREGGRKAELTPAPGQTGSGWLVLHLSLHEPIATKRLGQNLLHESYAGHPVEPYDSMSQFLEHRKMPQRAEK